MKYNRELEKKFVVAVPREIRVQDSFEVIREDLMEIFPEALIEEGSSTDTFWTQKGTDFIRLRRNTSELSVKVTDKDTIEDRLEENIVVKDYDVARRFATATFGQPVGTLTKDYAVFTLPNFIIALYTVQGDSRLFMEVEADDMGIVNDVSEVLKEHFDLRQEFRSLFQLIFGEAV